MADSAQAQGAEWPEDVGIIGIEVYFPKQYVDQSELEDFDGVSKGKYTIGLGQSKMGFCSDNEDINSMCLTVVHRIMKKYNIEYSKIGRLEVGTETILDKSKSVKTVLMQLFGDNTSVEGIDTTNACYGGTAALFNAVNWIESSYWDGRLALVVAGDIAVYATGNARSTGGAGAVAMLIGPDAPIIFERGCRATHMEHVYDFYKPNLESEYPVVDGKLSIKCYLGALDKCYKFFTAKIEKQRHPIPLGLLEYFDAFIFHSPYCKLVQKSLARIMLNDFIKYPDPEKYSEMREFSEFKLQNKAGHANIDKDVDKSFMEKSEEYYKKKTKPSLLLANQIGNMYTPSVYGGLVSYLISHDNDPEDLCGRRIVLFSYGSGLASSMYSMRITEDLTAIKNIVEKLIDVKINLHNRKKVAPQEFDQLMQRREVTHHKAPYTPVASPKDLFPETYYLVNVDKDHKREYKNTGDDLARRFSEQSLQGGASGTS